MNEERLLADFIKELTRAKKSGALYVSVVETSEDLVRIYFEEGRIYHIRYGTAVGNDCLDILEYYNLYSATFFQGIKAPDKPATDLPSSEAIVAKIASFKKTVKVK